MVDPKKGTQSWAKQKPSTAQRRGMRAVRPLNTEDSDLPPTSTSPQNLTKNEKGESGFMLLARKGCDYVDLSLVDGWTLPVKFEASGDCGPFAERHGLVFLVFIYKELHEAA